MLLSPEIRTGETWEPATSSAVSKIGQLWTENSVTWFWVPAGDEGNVRVFLRLPKCIVVKMQAVRGV